MATLHVRNVPDKLHRRIRSLADAERRSLSAQVIATLEDALRENGSRPAFSEVLQQMRRLRLKYPPKEGEPDSLSLLREDRAR